MAQRQAPNLKDAQNIVRQRLSVYARELPTLRAVTGRSNGSVEVDNPDKAKQGYIYVRVRGDDTALWEVLNFQGPLTWNLPVIIQLYNEEKNIWAVKEVDHTFFAKTGGFEGRANLAAHAPSHAWPDGNPGEDPINVYARNIVPLRGFAIPGQGLTIFVAPARVPDAVGGVQIYTGGQTTIPGGSLPAAGQIRFVLISLDLSDLSLTQTLGDPTADGPAVVPPIPDVPADEVPSCLVLLKNGDTDFDETRFADYRLFVSSPVAAKVYQLWESDFGNVAAEAGPAGNVTFHQNIILDGTSKAIQGVSNSRPALGDAADSTKRWGDMFMAGGRQFNVNGDFTFTANVWTLKGVSTSTWAAFSNAGFIEGRNSFFPSLGSSSTAANKWGNIYLTGGSVIDSNGSLGIQAAASGEVVFNDGGADVDFRVEGTSTPNAFFVHGADGNIGKGTSSPQAPWHVLVSGTPGTPASIGRTVGILQGDGSAGNFVALAIVAGTTGRSVIDFGDSDDIDRGSLQYDHAGDFYSFQLATAEKARLTSAPIFFLGDTANANMTIGLTINQAANADEALALKGTGVAHGITNFAETDTYYTEGIQSATDGGAKIRGYSEVTIGYHVESLYVTDTAVRSTAARAPLEYAGWLRNGAGPGLTNPAAGQNLVAFRSGSNTRAIFDTDGQLHLDSTLAENVWDYEEDTQLLRALTLATGNPAQVIKSEFDSFLKYNKQDLIRLGILSEGMFINWTQTWRLMMGALWQQNLKISNLERRLNIND